ncbi:MAG: PAS domain S-box protein [Bacteroidota bacterium]
MNPALHKNDVHRILQSLTEVYDALKVDNNFNGDVLNNKADVDTICLALNSVTERLKEKNKEAEEFKNHFEDISEVILEYSVLNFTRKVKLSNHNNVINSIISGLNRLGEELEFSLNSQNKYAHELEKANELLLESNEKVHAIFNNTPDAIIATDLNYTITEWNNAAERMYGYLKDEVVGSHLENIIQTKYIEPFSKKMATLQLKNNGEWSSELIQSTDRIQNEIRVQSTNSCLRNDEGVPTGYLGVNKDITELKKIEMSLKISEEKFNKAFMLSPVGLVLTKVDTSEYVEVNDSFLKITGYDRNEIIGHSSLIINVLDKEDRNKILEEFHEDGSVKNKEVNFTKKNGEKGVLLFSTEVIEINNEPSTLTIIYDISKRKAIEIELNKKSEELIRSNAELEQFAYIASHDLQEPLRMITSYVQLLEKRYSDKLDQDAHDFISYAVDGASRMQTLIYSLLEYSRVNRVKPFEYIDIHDVLSEVMKDLAIVIKENTPDIKIGDLPVIFGDKVLIGQLFFNLIANAIKFKSEKPIEIFIEGKREGSEFKFSVKDNGIGIQKEYSKKIFTIFQRLHTKDKYPGTGIGLAICKKIVERHEGRIWIDSDIDKGSTFYFTIKTDLISPKSVA